MMTTPQVVRVPTVLAVGCTPDVLSFANHALAVRGIALRESALRELGPRAASVWPLIVLVNAAVYDGDPDSFEAASAELGAALAVVCSVKEAEIVLERLLIGIGFLGTD